MTGSFLDVTIASFIVGSDEHILSLSLNTIGIITIAVILLSFRILCPKNNYINVNSGWLSRVICKTICCHLSLVWSLLSDISTIIEAFQQNKNN